MKVMVGNEDITKHYGLHICSCCGGYQESVLHNEQRGITIIPNWKGKPPEDDNIPHTDILRVNTCVVFPDGEQLLVSELHPD